MSPERLKLSLRRLFWGILLLLGILIPILMLSPSANFTKNAVIVKENGYINNYYEYLNQTDCEIEVTFNTNVTSAKITVAFYDINNKLLSKETKQFYGSGNTLSATFYIGGKVDSYEITSYNAYATANNFDESDNFSISIALIFIYADIFILAFFIESLWFSCRTYYYNNNQIIVYAVRYHHYIKINGIKFDEHNTLIYFNAIKLSCVLDDGTDIKATISLSKRIALKINNQLYNNYK